MAEPGAGASGRDQSPPNTVHDLEVRVYYEDTDAGGIVYHANYLRFAERARTEMLRILGFQQSHLLQQEGIAFAVTRCEVDFRAPARLDDRLRVSSRLTEVGAASIRFEQIIRRDGQPVAIIMVRIACINRDGRPVRMPAAIRRALGAGLDLVGERGKSNGVDSD